MAVLLLGLSAAFSTVDHSILKDRLKKWVGVFDGVLAWFKSYLTDRQSFWQAGCSYETYDIPQGSIFGPVWFLFIYFHLETF